MTFDEFVEKYNGKATDYDGGYGVQCVDLIKLYADKVLGITIGAIGNAEAYWNKYSTTDVLKNNFEAIENTVSFVPQKGDIMVWNTTRGNGSGHVAICTGEGSTSYFYSYDQNWNGSKEMKLVKHTYASVYGVLRAKNQANIADTYKQGDIVEIKMEVGICCEKGNFYQVDNFEEKDNQFDVHKSVVKDGVLNARVTVCAVEEDRCMVQCFNDENGSQFWVPNKYIKKL